MLLRNDLLQYAPAGRTLRVLWVDPARTIAYLFDVNGNGCDVESARVQALEADLDDGRAVRLAEDPYLVVADQDAIKPGHLALRERAWAIVEELTSDEPGIYEPRRRGQLIADYTERHGISHPTLYRYLRRYWQRGQTPNALLPDYGNSGARGKTRSSTAGIKRGRPRRDGAAPGINVDEALRRLFRVAVATYPGQRFSRRGAYETMLREFFAARSAAEDTWLVTRDEAGAAGNPAAPTFGQFSYWLDQGNLLRGADRPLPLPAHAVVDAMGRPGAAFHIAAVRADIQLVDRADRRKLAGRPVLYLARDAFSGMVTGFHVSLAAPSAQQALMALAHCAADKPRHAQRHGRTLATQDWPCQHLPELVLIPGTLGGGRAGFSADALLNNFGVRCAVGMPGDVPARAALERRFGLLRLDAPALSPQLGPLDGALDLGQFSRLVIDAVVEHNLQGADATAPAPLQLWDWGIRERGAAFKQVGEELVRCALLPVHEALVTQDGICLDGVYYSCAKAVEERWFERARQRGRWAVRVACDAAEPDCIYLPDPAAALRFHACHRIERGAQPAAPFVRSEAPRRPAPGQYASFDRIVAGFVG